MTAQTPTSAVEALRAQHIKRLEGLIRPCTSKGWLGEIDALRWAIAALAASQEAPKAGEPWAPEKCPITGRPFFMWIERDGREVPTYGGPFDSYTIPVRDDDDYLTVERYDHDRGHWMDSECLGLRVTDDRIEHASPTPLASQGDAEPAEQRFFAKCDRCGARDAETCERVGCHKLTTEPDAAPAGDAESPWKMPAPGEDSLQKLADDLYDLDGWARTRGFSRVSPHTFGQLHERVVALAAAPAPAVERLGGCYCGNWRREGSHSMDECGISRGCEHIGSAPAATGRGNVIDHPRKPPHDETALSEDAQVAAREADAVLGTPAVREAVSANEKFAMDAEGYAMSAAPPTPAADGNGGAVDAGEERRHG